jgi:octaprenyl-diphosphate synthase
MATFGTVIKSTELQELVKPIVGDLERLDKLQSKALKNESPLIYAISQHILHSRGKRLRPLFTFLISKATGFKSPHLTEAALAVEMIHTATLLHDDVVDQSDTRRGALTVNSKWNNLISILMGDYFFSKAFTLLVKTGSGELLQRVSMASERVAVGELRQIEESFNFELTEEEYLKIISDKTASLFQTSAASPPLLSGAPAEMVERLARFGENTGCAFQIADDLLDFIGEAKLTGKKPGNDLAQGRITLPLIYSFSKTQTRTRRSIVKILENGTTANGFERVLDFVHSSGGIDYARARANSLTDKALTYLKPFSGNRHYKSLERLAAFSIDRDV